MRKMAQNHERYSDMDRYLCAQHLDDCMNKAGKIVTEVYGQEKLPKEGGYVMYPNHQGKYDATSIIYAHKLPCSFVMDKAKSYQFFVREMVNMLGAKRLELNNLKQNLQIIIAMTEEIKAGKRFILFSEGRYIPCVINNSALKNHFAPGDALEVSVKKINRSYLDSDFIEKEMPVYEVLDYQN